MAKIEFGRGGAMVKDYKTINTKDLMKEYFNHPIWQMN
jgi:hypothetical protein